MIEIVGNALLGFLCGIAANEASPRDIKNIVRRWLYPGKLPLEDNLKRAFSEALLEATSRTISDYEKTECPPDQKSFVRAANKAVTKIRKTNDAAPFAMLADDKGTLDWGKHLLSLKPLESSEIYNRIRKQLETFMLDQLYSKVKDKVPFPDDFRDYFRNPNRGNWYGNLYTFFMDEIERNPKAETKLIFELLSEIIDNSISPDFLKAELERVAAETNALGNKLIQKIPDAVVEKFKKHFPGLGSYPGGKECESDPLAFHTPTQNRTVFFAGYRGLPESAELFDDVWEAVSRKASRLDKDEMIALMEWDFLRSAEHKSDRELAYAKTEAWKTIDDRVIGGILVLDQDLQDPIYSDMDFFKALKERGWLKRVVEEVVEMSDRDRLEFYDHGGIPITYETRFAFECLFRNKSLLLIAPKANKSWSQSTRNFVTFLKSQGITCLTADELEGETDWVNHFLTGLPGVKLNGLPNPYRGLDFYQIGDAETYVGREDEAAWALELLKDAQHEKRGLLLGITGPSGCGKSSFMRARVAARAQQELSLQTLEFRPTDFRFPQEVDLRCLPILCAGIADLLETEPPATLVGPKALFRHLHLPNFKKWLDRTIDGECTAPVLICLDQFEEILDDLSEGVHAEEWQALIDILTHLSTRHHWPIVFTLEDSRKDRFERWQETISFKGADMIPLADTDTAFYRRIIIKPFRDAQMDLDREIVKELLDEVADLRDEADGKSSPLPLLALRLYHLFQDVSPRAPKPHKSELGREFSRLRVTYRDLAGRSLALGDVVADLAETAWKDGGGKDEPASINFFLRPLVRISLDPDHREDAKLVLQSVRGRGYRDEKALQTAFRKRRVLIPSGGGFRLVHEAVIRRWPRAKTWFERERTELEEEAVFRSNALQWHENGSPNLADCSEEELNRAVRILGANLREWTPRELPHLDPEAEALRRYALEVFQTSHTPAAVVCPEDPNNRHVHIAASYGLNDLLKFFFEIDPESANHRTMKLDRTPLYNASWNHLSTVEILIEAGADVQAVEANGFCPLYGAIWAGREDIVKVMLDHVSPETWGKDRINPLNGAAALGRIDIAEMLTMKGFRYDQPTVENWTPLHQAATVNHLDNFKYFLERGNLNIRWRNRTPFHIAAANGCADIVRHLLTLEEGCALLEDPGDDGETPLMAAAWFQRYPIVEILLEVMADPNGTSSIPGFEGYNALHFAIQIYSLDPLGSTEHLKNLTRLTAEALLKSPELDVAAKTQDGRTAWEMASGLPEVQRAIASHPRFPDDLYLALQKEEQQKAREREKEKLFHFAESGNKRAFKGVLARMDASWDIEITKSIDDEQTSIDELMLLHDWTDIITELILLGRIDPWRQEDGYTGLYTSALKKKEVELVEVLEKTMPEGIPLSIALHTFNALRRHNTEIDDPEGQIRRRIYSHLTDQDLNEMLFYVARLGDVESYLELLENGADPNHLDAWNRTSLDVASDALRESLEQPAFGVDGGRTGCSVFYPDDVGWRPLENNDIIERVPQPDDLTWDERVVWSEHRLSFYADPEVRLIRAKHPDWTPASRYIYFLVSPLSLFRLAGTSWPIHEFNRKYPLNLDDGRDIEYLKFFCFFKRGDEGPYYVPDGPEAHFLPDRFKQTDDQEDTLFSFFRRVYRGPRFHGRSDAGYHRISSLVYYSNAIYMADFEVQPSGMIDMSEDWPLMTDLPEKIEAPL